MQCRLRTGWNIHESMGPRQTSKPVDSSHVLYMKLAFRADSLNNYVGNPAAVATFAMSLDWSDRDLLEQLSWLDFRCEDWRSWPGCIRDQCLGEAVGGHSGHCPSFS